MNEKQLNSNNIEEMLRRFFDGDTTCAEEKMLESYFCSGGEVPPEYECYRDMFGWYASGMDENALPDAQSTVLPIEKTKPKRRRQRILLWWGSVAAAIAIVIGLGWNQRVEQLAGPSLYAGSFVVRDGMLITGDDEIKGDIEATILEGDCLDAEIDTRIAMLNIENSQM